MSIKESMKSKFYYGYTMAFLGFMIMFVVYVLKANCTSLFIVPITNELHLSRTAYTFHLTIIAFTMMFSSGIMGKVLTKYKVKYVMSGCLALLALSYIIFSMVTALWQIYAIAVVQGFAYGAATTLPVNIFISNWFGPKRKGTWMSIAMLGSGAGALVWVNLCQKVITLYGWRAANVSIGIIFAVVMLPLIFFFAVNTPAEMGYSRRPGDPDIVDGSKTTVLMKRGIDGKEALKMPRFWLQMIGQILLVACASGFTTQCVPYLTDLGLGKASAAAIYSGALGTLIAGKFVLGFISDYITPRRAALLSPLIFAGTFIALNLVAVNRSMTNVVIWTYMIGGAIATIIPPLLTAKNFGDKDFGTIQGFVTMGGNIGQMIGPLIASIIFDITGSYRNAWIVYAILMIVVGVCFFFSTSLSKKRASELEYE